MPNWFSFNKNSVGERISWRILLALTATAVLALCGGMLINFYAIDRSFKESAKRHTETLSTFVVTEFYFYDIQGLNITLKKFSTANVFARIELYDRFDNLLTEVGNPTDPSWYFIRERLEIEGGVHVGELRIWFDSGTYQASLKSAMLGSLTILVLTILTLGGALIRRFLNREVLLPIKTLRRHVTSTEHFQERLTFNSTEFQDLSDSFNHLTRRLEHKASTDELTGLYNRRKIIEILNFEVEKAQIAGAMVRVFFIDLDKFKQINDHMGHAVGDALLVSIGQGLKQLGIPNLYVARLGGDEFLGVQCQATPENAKKTAQALLGVINRENHLQGHAFKTSGSCGYATYPKDGTNAEEIMQNADLALYQAKADGRRRFVEYNQLQRQASYSQFSETEFLLSTLETGNIQHHFQEIVDARSYNIWGAEALLRVGQAGTPLIHPQKIIAMASEIGLLDRVTELSIRNTAKAFRQKPHLRNITVNFSRAQLLQYDVADYTKFIFLKDKIPLNALVIEVTEDGLLEDEMISNRLKELSDKGFRIALDDFGSGHSALACIRDLPLEIIKLDKTLLAQTARRHKAELLFGGIVAIAHQMNCSVIAEGVETEAELKMVQRYGCELAQGYYFNGLAKKVSSSSPRPIFQQSLTTLP